MLCTQSIIVIPNIWLKVWADTRPSEAARLQLLISQLTVNCGEKSGYETQVELWSNKAGVAGKWWWDQDCNNTQDIVHSIIQPLSGRQWRDHPTITANSPWVGSDKWWRQLSQLLIFQWLNSWTAELRPKYQLAKEIVLITVSELLSSSGSETDPPAKFWVLEKI